MVENSSSVYTLASLEGGDLIRVETPELCEVWTWQGDTSILPHKFESVLNAAATEADYIGFGKEVFKHGELKKKFIQRPDFDPDGFFFITYRSNAIGLTLALPDGKGGWTIPFLTAVPNHYGKGVEMCLMSLVL